MDREANVAQDPFWSHAGPDDTGDTLVDPTQLPMTQNVLPTHRPRRGKAPISVAPGETHDVDTVIHDSDFDVQESAPN